MRTSGEKLEVIQKEISSLLSGEERKGLHLRTKANPRKWDEKWGRNPISVHLPKKNQKLDRGLSTCGEGPMPFIKGGSWVQVQHISIHLTREVLVFLSVSSLLVFSSSVDSPCQNFPSHVRRLKWAGFPLLLWREAAKVGDKLRPSLPLVNQAPLCGFTEPWSIAEKRCDILPFPRPKKRTQIMLYLSECGHKNRQGIKILPTYQSRGKRSPWHESPQITSIRHPHLTQRNQNGVRGLRYCHSDPNWSEQFAGAFVTTAIFLAACST